MSPHRQPQNGFWITWTRLALLVVMVAAIPTGVFVYLSLSEKVGQHDLTEAFREGCKRNAGGARDRAAVLEAEARYKRAVLAAASVKGDVKRGVTKALQTYDEVIPRERARVIDCNLAFPNEGKPRIVRVP